MTTQIQAPVYFKLKSAKDYAFWGRGNQRRLQVKFGEVVEMTSTADIDYFRARGDVMIECSRAGIAIEELDGTGPGKSGKAKSFRVYGRRGPQPVAPSVPVVRPRVMQVGTLPPVVRAPAITGPPPVTLPLAAPVAAPPAPPVAPNAQTPGQSLPGIPPIGSGDLSPLEEASADGSTRAVRPRVDPGM